MARTLYRAAAADSPYFGRGSYWTHSESFARRFGLWLDETYEGQHVVYRAEVALTDVLAVPFGVFLSPPEVSKRVDQLATAYRWLTFYESGAFEGRMTMQYVYLGEEPIRADQAGDSK
jgi:hypothetical protein